MKHFSLRWLSCVAIAGLWLCQSAFGQLPTADLTRIHPPSGRANETVTVQLVGQNLDDVQRLQFTHPGITATPVMLPPNEFFSAPRRDGTRFTVTIGEQVPPGTYEARAAGYFGLSTSRPFVVAPADSREVNEAGDHSTRDKSMPIQRDAVVFGSVSSRGIDWYRFHAQAGTRLLIDVFAERIDSRMDGLLVLYDEAGREVGRNREHFGRDPFLELNAEQDGEYFLAVSDILYRGSADHFYRLSVSDRPHIDFVNPPAGQPGTTQTYTLFGRNLPGSTPSGLVAHDGRPLEALDVEISLPSEAQAPMSFHPGTPRQALLPGIEYRFHESNSVRIGFATAPVVVETAGQEVQEVSVPSEIAGCFDEPNDEDVFRFNAQKGKTYCIEAIADRMGSKVDPYLVVHRLDTAAEDQETTIQVAENDDMPSFFSIDSKGSINADTIDAALTFTAEADGPHVVTIVNQFGDGSPVSRYRLAIRHPKHGFQLIATTEHPLPTNRTGFSVTPHLRQGAKWGIRILAPRQDGFEGDIVVTAEGLPAGVTAEPLTLSGKTDRGILVVAASESAEPWAGAIRVLGQAEIDGQPRVREAHFASLVWGHIFADSIRVRSRLTSNLPLSVNGYEAAPTVLAVNGDDAGNKVWQVKVGETLEIPIRVTDNGMRKGNLTVEPFGLFGLLRNPPTVNIAENATTGTLAIGFQRNGNFQVEPGRYQFALKGVGVCKYRANVRAHEEAIADRERIEATLARLKAEPSVSAEKLAQAEKAKAEADRRAEATEKRAAPTNTKFAVWSELITVEVVAPTK